MSNSVPVERIRNVAIIAHVDHGKTTLVDKLLRQSGTLSDRGAEVERVLDSNQLEQERGITILAKNTAIHWNDYWINIVDTPGHADFGGEVERVLSMVDAVLLLVDAVEGPMPQTRFVTRKAFDHGLKPIVVINKIDRDAARPDWVLDQTFNLFDNLGATDEQLDFPVIYASAIQGFSSTSVDVREGNMDPLFNAIVEQVPAPSVDRDGPFQMQISALDFSSYVGAIGIGRVSRGAINANSPVVVARADGTTVSARILQIFGFLGLERVDRDACFAGEIVAVTGIERPLISDTLCEPGHADSLTALTVDEPTVGLGLLTNDSPFAGREGKYLTSRQIGDRLEQELLHNVALRVEQSGQSEAFSLAGRGELHLSILLENMRREGYEMSVSRPQVIFRDVDGERQEPYELVTLDIEANHQGPIMEALGERRGQLRDMAPGSDGRVRLEYIVPSRTLIGYRSEFLTASSGTGIMHQVFDHYGAVDSGARFRRRNGVLISNGTGKALGFALFNLQERGRLIIGPGEEVYEGQVVGIHSRDNDLTVNPLKGKQLTNVRASGKDDAILLTPPVRFTLEQALEFIEDDELVELTPESIRVRKKRLTEVDRKRESRQQSTG